MAPGFFDLLTPFCQAGGTILLLLLPGWAPLKSLKQDPLTRFVVAITVGFALLYVLEFGAYLISAPQWVPLLVYLMLCAGLIRFRSNGESFNLRQSFSLDGFLVWFGLSCWILALQSKIVTYGAVNWFGDWYEHYERSIFFSEQLPFNFRFLTGFWSLPARAPLFNANLAFLMNFFGKDFWTYQTLATVLNTFPVLPAALLIRDLGRVRQRTALACSFALCAVAPFAVIQETYTWTKFLSIGLTLAGTHLYVLGTRSRQPALVFWSFVAFAAGMLTHYLTLVFAIFFGVHLLMLPVRRKWEMKHVVIPVLCSSALVLTWVGTMFLVFGVKETLTANSTFGNYAKLKSATHKAPPWGEVFAGNVASTFIPYSWRHGFTGLGAAPVVRQVQPLPGKVTVPTIFPFQLVENDLRIERYSDQTANADSLTANIGWVGVLALIAVIAGRKRKDTAIGEPEATLTETQPGRLFWLLFFALGIPLNIFLCRVYMNHGVAHINLQPFVFLLAVFVIRKLQNLTLTAKILLAGLFFAEAAYNTHAILTLQNFPVAVTLNGDQLQILGRVGLNHLYIANYLYKLQVNAVFLSDHFGPMAGTFAFIAGALGIASMAALFVLISRPNGTYPTTATSPPMKQL